MISLLIALSCSKPIPPEPAASSGKIGVQYRRVENWMLVTRVLPGMPAELAGIRAGDRLLTVNGEPIFDGEQNNVAGPANTELTLTVESPFSEASKSILLKRGGGQYKKTSAQNKVSKFLTLPEAERGAWLEQVNKDADIQHEFWRLILRSSALESWSPHELAILISHVPNSQVLNQLQSRFLKLNTLQNDGSPFLNEPTAWDSQGDVILTGEWPMLEWRNLLNQWEDESVNRADLGPSIRTLARASQLDAALLSPFGMAPYTPEHTWKSPIPSMVLPDIQLLNGEEWLWNTDEQLTVVNLWATWCGPCRREMPELIELSQQYEPSDVRFIAISTDKIGERSAVEEMVAGWDIPFATAHEPQIGRDFQVTGIPAIRVLNTEGQLVYSVKGYSGSSIQNLADEIDKQLVESQPIEETFAYTLETPNLKLQAFIGMANVQSITVENNRLWAALNQQPPIELMSQREVSKKDAELSGYHPNELIAYCDGPVVADKGGYLLRGYSDKGRPTWEESTFAPILEIQSFDDLIYVTTTEALHILDGDGDLKATHLGDWLDISVAENGIWGLYNGERALISGVEFTEVTPAPEGSAQVDSQGGFTSTLYAQPIVSQIHDDKVFIFYRPKSDHSPAAIIWKNSNGLPQYLFLTGEDHTIRLWNNEETNIPELVVSIPNLGVAIFQFVLDL